MQERDAHPRRRALAVRPGDVDDGVGRLRVADRRDERARCARGVGSAARPATPRSIASRLTWRSSQASASPSEAAPAWAHGRRRACGRPRLVRKQRGADGRTSRPVPRGRGVGATRSSTTDLSTTQRPTSLTARQVVHHLEEDLLEDGPQAPGAGAAQQRLFGDGLERVLGDLELDVVELEHPPVLLHERVLRLDEDADERLLGRGCDTAPMTGRRPTNSGMRPNFSRSSGSTCMRSSLSSRRLARRGRRRGSRCPRGRCGSR